MIKTINLENGQELTLSNNVGWLFEYQNQFGHDIVPVLMPAVSSVVRLASDIAKQAQGETVKDILGSIEADTLTDALIELAGLRLTDVLNIVWAMAKTAETGVPAPRAWFGQFESFPLDVVIPAAFELILAGVVSTKNADSLRNLLNDLKRR